MYIVEYRSATTERPMLFQNKSRGLVTFHLSGATRRFAVEDKAEGVAMPVAELRHIDWCCTELLCVVCFLCVLK
eukprot:scaffold88057_cov68-Cyclotella_meneghiniana.AAC.2